MLQMNIFKKTNFVIKPLLIFLSQAYGVKIPSQNQIDWHTHIHIADKSLKHSYEFRRERAKTVLSEIINFLRKIYLFLSRFR